jgi:hypothetical protein
VGSRLVVEVADLCADASLTACWAIGPRNPLDEAGSIRKQLRCVYTRTRRCP